MLCLERLTRIDRSIGTGNSGSGSESAAVIGSRDRNRTRTEFGAVVVFFVGALERSCDIC